MSDAASETTSDTVPTEYGQRPDSIPGGPGGRRRRGNDDGVHRHRPFMVTILAIVVGLLAVLAAVHLLQALGIVPYVIGRIEIRTFSLLYAIMWGGLLWVWIWLIQMLWRVEPQAWIFLVFVSLINMFFDFMMLLGATTWSDVAVSFLLNGPDLALLHAAEHQAHVRDGVDDAKILTAASVAAHQAARGARSYPARSAGRPCHPVVG